MSRKRKSGFSKKLKRLLITLLILIIVFLILCILTPSESTLTASDSVTELGLPSPIEGEAIISHTGYTLSYNEQYEVPSWVSYELTRDEVPVTSFTAELTDATCVTLPDGFTTEIILSAEPEYAV